MLEFDRVTRRFGATVALDELSFVVAPGRICGFCGANGAGKTTALRILAGILDADSGEVRWRGDPVDRDIQRRFGYLPEERGLYPSMHVGDHLVYLARLHGLSRQRASRSCERVLNTLDLTDFASRRVDSLSLGGQQRVQLASALVHDPMLLVLDEPFNGLDPVIADKLALLLFERAESGATVLFSSHQLEMVERLCTDAVIIDRGRTVVDGAIDDLTDVDGSYRSLLDLFRGIVRDAGEASENAEVRERAHATPKPDAAPMPDKSAKPDDARPPTPLELQPVAQDGGHGHAELQSETGA